MNQAISRRDAVKVGVGAVVGTVLAGVAGGWPSRADAQPTTSAASKAQAFVTDPTGRRHARLDDVLSADFEKSASDIIVRVDSGAPLQSILGFGAALTDAACATISRLPSNARAALLDELYSPAKTNFGIGRLCIGASDYATSLYSYDEGNPDPSLSRFSIDHDRVAVLPVLQQARGVRPDLFLFGSPWSPPGWMKYSGTMLGGSIKPMYLDAYAHYILKYLQAYAAAGVTVDAMTIQNEIDADQEGRMPACTWSQEVEARYVGEHLGPLLAGSDQHPQLWILDHNYDLAGRVLDQLSHESYRKYISAVAWHGYAGRPEAMMRVHQSAPGLDMHWTEGGDELGADRPVTSDWARWGSNFATILNNGVRSITTWNLALDETGHPNIGPFHCAGMVTIDSHSQAITRNGIFWALSHYSRALVKSSRVLPCTVSAADSVLAVAARRPDGSFAVVVSNTGPPTRVRLELGSASGQAQPTLVTVAENSVTTVLLPA